MNNDVYLRWKGEVVEVQASVSVRTAGAAARGFRAVTTELVTVKHASQCQKSGGQSGGHPLSRESGSGSEPASVAGDPLPSLARGYCSTGKHRNLGFVEKGVFQFSRLAQLSS